MESKTENIDVSRKKVESDLYFDSQQQSIMAACFAIFVPILIFYLYQRRKALGQNVLLVGLCEAGKTLIFAQLVHNTFAETQTSMKENSGEYSYSSGVLNIIDIPGHERLRNKFFDQFKAGTRAILFVIDSVTIQKDIRDVAEFLYNCLADPIVTSLRPPMLILCNKQDQPMAKGSTLVKSLLEKEINILRRTKTSQVESVENSTSDKYLGVEGKDFEFSDLRPMRIDFIDTSAVSKDDDSEPELESVHEWLENTS